MTDIIDGTKLSAQIYIDLNKRVDDLERIPELHAIIVGSDAASKIYVKRKENAAAKVGILSYIHELPENTSEADLVKLIVKLNNKAKCDGILVQLPLPKHINPNVIFETIDPNKDVDCFHPDNFGRMMAGNPKFVPCTPMAILKLLRSTGVEIKGASTLVIGRSTLVGMPTAVMLSHYDATVTIAHSKTQNLRDLCEQAEILVVAVGRPHMIPGSYIQKDAIVIDVGINRVVEKLVVGDVNFNEALGRAGAITPVPGGVGPMTIACLLENTIQAYKLNAK